MAAMTPPSLSVLRDKIDAEGPKIRGEIKRRYDREYHRLAVRTDRMFTWLMALQWIGGIALACVVSPTAWSGTQSALHVHVLAAVLLGGALTVVPMMVARAYPGELVTRVTIAVAQMMWSGLLIHLSGGRIETHFHIFGSLAMLAFYRDMRVLLPATLVTGLDHFVRGVWWPESIYGVASPEVFRFVEHVAWVVFIDVFLVMNTRQSRQDLQRLCEREILGQAATEVAARAYEEVVRGEEREVAARQRESTQKLEAIGQLAAGIAHEINTPVQYVSDNVAFLRTAFVDLVTALEATEVLLQKRKQGMVPEEADYLSVMSAFEAADMEYLAEEMPSALSQSADGLGKVATIVRAMKEFSHPSGGQRTEVDLTKLIETTLTVARSEWNQVADVETDFDPGLPYVNGIRDELSQVFLNIIVNAAHAISDNNDGGASGKGSIRIAARRLGDSAEIRITDDGGGIPEAIRKKVFDPFFTTKEVGRGTGQGLAIARDVVVKKHGGDIGIEVTDGVGTTFVLTLPIAGLEAEPVPGAPLDAVA